MQKPNLKGKVRGVKHEDKLLVVSLQIDRELNKPNFQFGEYDFYVMHDDTLFLDLSSNPHKIISGMQDNLDKYQLDKPQIKKVYTKIRGIQYGFFEALMYTITAVLPSDALDQETLQCCKEMLRDKLLIAIEEEEKQLKQTDRKSVV